MTERKSEPDFETPEEMVQRFLLDPPGREDERGVTVQMTYRQLLALVTVAFQKGAQSRSARQALVNPFTVRNPEPTPPPPNEPEREPEPTSDLGRFDRLEYRSKENDL